MSYPVVVAPFEPRLWELPFRFSRPLSLREHRAVLLSARRFAEIKQAEIAGDHMTGLLLVDTGHLPFASATIALGRVADKTGLACINAVMRVAEGVAADRALKKPNIGASSSPEPTITITFDFPAFHEIIETESRELSAILNEHEPEKLDQPLLADYERQTRLDAVSERLSSLRSVSFAASPDDLTLEHDLNVQEFVDEATPDRVEVGLALARVALSQGAFDGSRIRLDEAVRVARESGATWADISRAVGKTLPATQRRWDAAARKKHNDYQRKGRPPAKVEVFAEDANRETPAQS